MIPTTTPPAELTAVAIRVLCREIGVVNTVRFLNQFRTGSGDYTKSRDEFNGSMTVDEIMDAIERRKETALPEPEQAPK